MDSQHNSCIGGTYRATACSYFSSFPEQAVPSQMSQAVRWTGEYCFAGNGQGSRLYLAGASLALGEKGSEYENVWEQLLSSLYPYQPGFFIFIP